MMRTGSGATDGESTFRLRPAVRRLFAADALLPDGCARDVMLEWNDAGVLTRVAAGVDASRFDASRVHLSRAHGEAPVSVRAQTDAIDAADVHPAPRYETAAGPLLPGMPNLHSQAFQRAFAGQGGCRIDAGGRRWRMAMYRAAAAISPAQLEAVATFLYLEMLEAGYTSVCEFPVLHDEVEERPGAWRGQGGAAMAMGLMRAAEEVGIGLTLLPVLYQTMDFGGRPAPRERRRLVRSTDSMVGLLAGLKPVCDPRRIRLGLGLHSLRAVPPDSLREALAGLHSIDASAPIHLRIAERGGDVDDCVVHRGQRPVRWLLDHVGVDARWCLVHATHLDAGEVACAARSGTVAGPCPTAEADRGDGLFDLVRWRAAGGSWGIGSDNQVRVDPAEELMRLAYGRRLVRGQRDIAASLRKGTSVKPGAEETDDGSNPMENLGPDAAASLWSSAVAGGARAAARPIAGLSVGQQADFVVLDAGHPRIAGLSAPAMLSAHLCADDRRSAIAEVWTAGRPRVTASRHDLHELAAAAFAQARMALIEACR